MNTTRTYVKRPPILNNRDADKAKVSDKPYQRKIPAAPGTILRIQPNGRKIWKLIQQGKPLTLGSLPIMTYAMAVEKALAILRGEDPDAQPEPEENEILTFEQFIERHYGPYVKANHSRPKESLSYLARFGLEESSLDDIRLVDIETWRIKQQNKGNSPNTVNRITSTLKASLQKAVDWELLPHNPLIRFKPLKIDKRRIVRYLSTDEIVRLKDALNSRDTKLKIKRNNGNEWRSERGYPLLPQYGAYADALTPLVILALNTGLRRGELWNLVWNDIDLKQDILTVHGKGAKSKQTRHIPLNATAKNVLKKYLGDPEKLSSGPVFGRHEFKKSFSTVLKDATIQNFRFHDLRHSFASQLVTAGVPLNTVRELLGHASLEMTLIYAHLAPDNLRAAVDMLD